MAGVAENFRGKFDAPGLSIAIARNGRMAYAEAFGVTGHDSREPLTTSNLVSYRKREQTDHFRRTF